MKKILTILSMALLFITGCKKEEKLQQQTKEVIKPHINAQARAAGATFRYTLLNMNLLNLSLPIITQSSNGTTRRLVRYIGKAYKYALIQTNADKTWSSMCIISSKPIPSTVDLYRFKSIVQDQIINYDLFMAGKKCIVNKIKIGTVMYDMDGTLPDGKLREGETICINHWWVVWDTDTLVIISITYMGSDCFTGSSSGGGGGSSNNPTQILKLPTQSVAQEILNSITVVESDNIISQNGAEIKTGDLIRRPRNIDWNYRTVYMAGSVIGHYVHFNTILWTYDTPTKYWMWESFDYKGEDHLSPYALAGYLPCVDGVATVYANPAISGDGKKCEVALDWQIDIKINCVIGWVGKSFWGMDTHTYGAQSWAVGAGF